MLVMTNLRYADVRKAFSEDIFLAMGASDGTYTTRNSTYVVQDGGTRMVNTGTGQVWHGRVIQVTMWDNVSVLVMMEATACGWKWTLRTSDIRTFEVA